MNRNGNWNFNLYNRTKINGNQKGKFFVKSNNDSNKLKAKVKQNKGQNFRGAKTKER